MEPQTPTERMIQEYVPGKQVTLAHLIANPGKDLFKKLGLPDAVSAVEYALRQVTRTLGELMRFTACPITRT
ncbi:hypothetical protein [Klebsiella pneumoniae]|uniref:hypothetical protein n=1 Tax=Klebsiella pneumoniae TaxID=573 RepID=UPI0023DCC7F2|nr:hypothetical protein [Klebsiella pneumoniae]EKV0351902.1 hypothetical protein [Klebsiella pneumoniae]MDF2194761.1 hypothetical protein [Klebsiella pneumoniae]MDF2202558.1 hypothetical protein [Klebsiella pneumoniae]MDF2217997.1 hypothetical protein [Klebsiella pneumoniae]WFF13717.1 hypothetical protein P7I15_04945 [Klebsiella pneumoniae]